MAVVKRAVVAVPYVCAGSLFMTASDVLPEVLELVVTARAVFGVST